MTCTIQLIMIVCCCVVLCGVVLCCVVVWCGVVWCVSTCCVDVNGTYQGNGREVLCWVLGGCIRRKA